MWKIIVLVLFLVSTQSYGATLKSDPSNVYIHTMSEKALTHNGPPWYSDFYYIYLNYSGSDIYREGPYNGDINANLVEMKARVVELNSILQNAVQNKKQIKLDTNPLPWQSPIRIIK